MKDGIAVNIHNVSKTYRLYGNRSDRLKEALNPFGAKYHKTFYALSGITLTISDGEMIGLIGRNGSGKTTLLRVIAGLITPTTGSVQIRKKLAILEPRLGFNPEMTGIENIYYSAAVLGLSRKVIAEKLEEIVEFADIGRFINYPIKIYSSGMLGRLGFAVAFNIDPDILLVDEALSTGDIKFQQKCFRRFTEFRDKGKTIILVTHSLGIVNTYCHKAIWLDEGKIKEQGRPKDILKSYVSYMSSGTQAVVKEEPGAAGKAGQALCALQWQDTQRCESFGAGKAAITKVALCSKATGHPIDIFCGGERVMLILEIRIKQDIGIPVVGFILKDALGNSIFGTNNQVMDITLTNLRAGQSVIGRFEFEFPRLKNGCYTISPAIAEGPPGGHVQQHWVHDAYVVQMQNNTQAARMGWYFLLDDARISLEEL